jgi:hypothetical protein
MDELALALRTRWHRHCGIEDCGGDWEAAEFDLVDQLERGTFPVIVPISVELFMEKDVVYLRANSPGQPPAGRIRRVVNLQVPYDRRQLCDTLIALVESRGKSDDPALSILHFLALTDRASFLTTAAKFFVDVLDQGQKRFTAGRRLSAWLARLHEHDAELIPELVERLMQLQRAAGRRLRDAILEALDLPGARDNFGWLAAADLVERLEEA